jgi:hypothetical protein
VKQTGLMAGPTASGRDTRDPTEKFQEGTKRAAKDFAIASRTARFGRRSSTSLDRGERLPVPAPHENDRHRQDYQPEH